MSEMKIKFANLSLGIGLIYMSEMIRFVIIYLKKTIVKWTDSKLGNETFIFICLI